MTQDRALGSRLLRRILFIVDPQRRKAAIPWYLNPVMVKEFRTRRLGRMHWLLRLVAVCAVTSLLLTFAAITGTTDWGVKTIGGMLVLLQVALVLVITPSLGAGMISVERESGGWDLLRMTPLSGFWIVVGKLLSVAFTLLLVLLATLPGYLVMVYLDPTMWLQVRQVVISLLMIAAVALSTSAVASTLFRRTSTATTAAYVLLGGATLVPLLIWAARNAPFGHTTVERALLVTPLGAALSSIQAPGFEPYELLPASWWIAGTLSAILLLAMVARVWRLLQPQ